MCVYLSIHLATTQGKCYISEKSKARPQFGGSGIIWEYYAGNEHKYLASSSSKSNYPGLQVGHLFMTFPKVLPCATFCTS